MQVGGIRESMELLHSNSMTFDIEKILLAKSFYLELRLPQSNLEVLDHIFCCKDFGGFSERNMAVFANTFSSLQFIHIYGLDQKRQDVKIRYSPPSRQHQQRKKTLNGWVFGVRFKSLAENILTDLDHDIISETLAKQIDLQAQRSPTLQDLLSTYYGLLEYISERESVDALSFSNQPCNITDTLISESSRKRVKEIAEICDLNERSLSRKIKNRLGISPKQFLLTTRSKKSVKQFMSWDSSISDYAHFLGYADQAHFSREFKKHTGNTPQKFILKWKGQSTSGNVRFIQDTLEHDFLKSAVWIE